MKWFLGILTFVTSVSSFATPWQPPTFERQRFTYKVERRELVFKNDRYQFEVQEICSGTSDIDVADLRNIPASGSWMSPNPMRCRSVVDGREREFWLSYNSLILKDGAGQALKTYGLSLWFRPVDNLPETMPEASSNSAKTRQLDLRNLLLESGAGQGVVCSRSSFSAQQIVSQQNPQRDCIVTNPVVYAATGEFETL